MQRVLRNKCTRWVLEIFIQEQGLQSAPSPAHQGHPISLWIPCSCPSCLSTGLTGLQGPRLGSKNLGSLANLGSGKTALWVSLMPESSSPLALWVGLQPLMDPHSHAGTGRSRQGGPVRRPWNRPARPLSELGLGLGAGPHHSPTPADKFAVKWLGSTESKSFV